MSGAIPWSASPASFQASGELETREDVRLCIENNLIQR